ncbi:MAG: histidine kinase [Hyphomicrobium sp.]|nr:histidine kinase [Hyphomicrobium sp.]
MRISLRLGLILAIAAILLGTLAMSAAFVYRHAKSKLEVEVENAIFAAKRSVDRALALQRGEPLSAADIRLIALSYDQRRHVSLAHFDKDGQELVRSHPAEPQSPAPDWFFHLISHSSRVIEVPLSGEFAGHRIAIFGEPRNEVSEVWSEVKLYLLMLTTFCIFTLAILSALVGYALSPLRRLIGAFERMGRGRFGEVIPETGAAEFARVTQGFNQMSTMLADIDGRNRQLDRQLETVQEEERQSLARDLHDDVGPLLFSIDVDASAIRDEAKKRGDKDTAERAASIVEIVAMAKEELRTMLWRLRPGVLLDLGLQNAVESLVSFWTRRHPEVAITVEIERKSWAPDVDVALLAIVREAVNNAFRHGKPRNISISIVTADDGSAVATVRNDGGKLHPTSKSGGMGVVGMRERAAILRGAVSIEDTDDGSGVVVRASLPVGKDIRQERGASTLPASRSAKAS